MGEPSNIEVYKAKQREISDKRIITIIQEKGHFESISELSNELPDMSYGGVQTAVNRLVKDGKIFARQFHDKEKGVAKKMIFSDAGSMNDFFANNQEDKEKEIALPKFLLILYDLFNTEMEAPQLVKKIALDIGVDIKVIHQFHITLLKEMGLSITDLSELEKKAKEMIEESKNE